MKKIQLPEEILDKLAQSTVERLLQGHYFREGVIRGEDLKSFADHQQVNRFLLFQVFQVWNMQLSKLKHPYFDFEHEEIKDTIKELRNQLSRHIVISQKEFAPMLKRAVFNNLKLLLDPSASFTSFFFMNRDKASLELFERYAPFFSDFDFVVNSILRYHQNNQLNTVARDVFFLKMDKVIELYNEKSETDIDTYRRNIFHELTERDLDEIVEEHQHSIRQKEEEAQRVKREEEKKRAEEEKRKEMEERRKQEEVRRQEEARKQEEKRKASEAEQQRLLAEKRKQEEEKVKAQEEQQKKQSFFDTLDNSNNIFDFDIEDNQATEKPEAEVPSTKAEEPLLSPITPPVAETKTPAVEQTKTPPPSEEKKAPQVEKVETAPMAKEEPESPQYIRASFDQEPAEETPNRIFDKVGSSKEQDKPKTILDSLNKEENQRSTIADSLISKKESIADAIRDKNRDDQASFLKEVAQKEEPKIEAPVVQKPIANGPKVVEEATKENLGANIDDDHVSTPQVKLQDTLGDFIKKKSQQGEEDKKPSVVEAAISNHTEKPQTIREKIQAGAQNTPVHENLNGNRKIKLNEIPIHKQYQFVQKVFEGNNVRFRIIVDKVNNARGKDEVEDIMNRFVLNNDGLDKNDAVVNEFLVLMRNRF